ncbi:MAG TPA: response regulator [Anaeromyxobacteraceae bacterium]|nr:response regulator [Anaeromyxobacteraceae bacterium]
MARVLVVDDDPDVRTAVARLLAGSHEVVEASGGAPALRRVEGGEAFDAILCDLMMPDLSGMKLYAALRARWPALAERVVVMTGGVFTPEQQSFLDSIPNRRVDKPFDLDALRAALATVLEPSGR